MKLPHKLQWISTLLICAGFIQSTPLFGQDKTTLRFEAVSLKPFQAEGALRTPGGEFTTVASCHGADENKPGASVPLGRCVFHHQTLRNLIMLAQTSPYMGRLPLDQLVSGGPSWIESSFFEGTAKAEDSSTTTADQLKQMVLTMLKDEFKLTFHKETKQISGYVLVPGKDGTKLKPFPPGGATPAGMTPEKRPAIGAGTLSGLTNILSQRFHTLVIDKSGIPGNFDFWSLPPAAEWDEMGSIFSAIEKELGLKLEPQKLPVEVIVIDHAEKPAPNQE